jgi:hypothetical protein
MKDKHLLSAVSKALLLRLTIAVIVYWIYRLSEMAALLLLAVAIGIAAFRLIRRIRR